MTQERYSNPISFGVEATHQRWMKQPGFVAAYDALADEYAAAAASLNPSRRRDHKHCTASLHGADKPNSGRAKSK